jgi:hypothetical protein
MLGSAAYIDLTTVASPTMSHRGKPHDQSLILLNGIMRSEPRIYLVGGAVQPYSAGRRFPLLQRPEGAGRSAR